MANAPPPEAVTGVNGFAERILAGETVFAITKANRAHTISGRALIVYDDGTNDLAQLGDFLTVAGYAITLWTPGPEPFKATKNGWIVSVIVQQSNRDAGVIQRGEVWVNVFVGADATSSTAGRPVCWGWVFTGGGFLSLSTREFEGGVTWPYGGGGSALLNFTITRTVAGTFFADIVPGNGSELVLEDWSIIATGTNTLAFGHLTAINSTLVALFNNLASGAANIATGPQTSSNAVTSSQTLDSTSDLARLIAGSESAQVNQGTGGATDTCQVIVNMRVKGALPIVTTGGTGTFTVTAGSIVPVMKG
jgi:hypothetical protein